MLPVYKAIRAMRILVAVSDGDMGRRITEKLAKEGFERITAVDNGPAVLQALSAALAARAPVDLLCLGMGLADRPELRAFDELRAVFSVSLLLLLDQPAAGSAPAANLAPGADDYMLAPVDPGLLVLKTERLLTRRFMKRELRRTTARNEMLFLNVLAVMVKVLEAKDRYARFHSENVSTLAAAGAREMGLQDDEVRRIGIAGILHDLGKLAIREAILMKPGPLEPQELILVRRHPLIASTLLEPIEQLEGALSYIRHHHEHYDGSGYPVGLAGEAIPLGARIVHAAEAFDAMTSLRAYSPARGFDDAMRELRELSGIQFDPQVAEAFATVLRRRGRPPLRRAEPERPFREVLEGLTRSVSMEPPPVAPGPGATPKPL